MVKVRLDMNGMDSGNEYWTVTVIRLPAFVQFAFGEHVTPVGNPAHADVTVIFAGVSAG